MLTPALTQTLTLSKGQQQTPRKVALHSSEVETLLLNYNSKKDALMHIQGRPTVVMPERAIQTHC